MANKNTIQNRAALAKQKGDVVCSRMRTQSGSSNLTVQKFTLSWGNQKQKTSRQKVACLTGKKQLKTNTVAVEQVEMIVEE